MSYPHVAYFVVQLNLATQGNEGELKMAQGAQKVIEVALPKKYESKKHI